MAVWFEDWKNSPVHKGVYQTAIGCGTAWLLVAALEFFEVLGAANPWFTSVIACLAFAVASSMIHRVFWRSYTPYITQDEATVLASPEALPAPPRARFWLAIAMLSIFACMFLIVINATHGKPVWNFESDFGFGWFMSISLTVAAMFQKPFNRILPSSR